MGKLATCRQQQNMCRDAMLGSSGHPDSENVDSEHSGTDNVAAEVFDCIIDSKHINIQFQTNVWAEHRRQV